MFKHANHTLFTYLVNHQLKGTGKLTEFYKMSITHPIQTQCQENTVLMWLHLLVNQSECDLFLRKYTNER